MKHLTLTLKSSDLQDTGQFEGYASTFGNVDQGGDLIEPGAFRESVAKARAEGWGIPMLWQHDQTMPSLSDFENFLREAGFSKSQATAIAGKGLKSLLRSESGSESNTDFLSALAAQIRD